ncbi:unnamed protein product [Paramecium sonneborni]|uniref:Uncharacterized protein n=1 Tax=Paramecium sonneborni TaxID=65129 RepID=A0A8S1P3Q3_9CILI|nr:unnamed protein product [Paramecium sonneborni]
MLICRCIKQYPFFHQQHSYDKTLNVTDEQFLPQQIPKVIINSSTLHQIPQEKPLVSNLANQIVNEVTPLINQILLLNTRQQEQYELTQIKNKILVERNQENEQSNYDKLLQDSNYLLQLKEQQITQLYHNQKEIIKDHQETLKELKKQKDLFMLRLNQMKLLNKNKIISLKPNNNRYSLFKILQRYLKVSKSQLLRYYKMESYIVIRVFFIQVYVIKSFKVLQNLVISYMELLIRLWLEQEQEKQFLNLDILIYQIQVKEPLLLL